MKIDELRRMMEKATRGPWYTKEYNALGYELGGASRPVYYHSWFGDWPKSKQMEDAALIVAMRNALPALLAVVEAAKAVDASAHETYDGTEEWACADEPVQQLAVALAKLEKA